VTWKFKIYTSVKKMVEKRIVLASNKIAELKANSDKFSGFGMFRSRTAHLEKIASLEHEIFKFDVLGLDYWEIYSIDASGYVQANSYFFNAEFDRGSEKVAGDFQNTIYLLLLSGLPVLLKEGIKTFFGCQLEPVSICEEDFIEIPVDEKSHVIQTITPARGIVVKDAPSWFLEKIEEFQELFGVAEIKMRVNNDTGLRIVSMDEFMEEMEKKVK
jgi:hypothetical protein